MEQRSCKALGAAACQLRAPLCHHGACFSALAALQKNRATFWTYLTVDLKPAFPWSA